MAVDRMLSSPVGRPGSCAMVCATCRRNRRPAHGVCRRARRAGSSHRGRGPGRRTGSCLHGGRPPRDVARGVEGELVDRRVRVGPGAPAEPDDLLAGLVLGRPLVAAVVVLPPGQRFRGRAAEDLAEVPGLHGGHVFDQAEGAGPGLGQRPAGVVLGQVVDLPEQRRAVPPQSPVQVVLPAFLDHGARACPGRPCFQDPVRPLGRRSGPRPALTSALTCLGKPVRRAVRPSSPCGLPDPVRTGSHPLEPDVLEGGEAADGQALQHDPDRADAGGGQRA